MARLHTTRVLDLIGSTQEQCLRCLAIALLFHPSYGGNAGWYAEQALDTSQPAMPGWLERLEGPLPPALQVGFDLTADDQKHYRLTLTAMRWILTGADAS